MSIDWNEWLTWLRGFAWDTLLAEWIGKGLGVLTGVAISWWLLFRKRLQAMAKAQAGDSDDIIYQMHSLVPIDSAAGPNASGDRPATTDTDSDTGNDFVLLFRNVAPKTTVNDLYDNIAVRDEIRRVANQCTLPDPILRTEGTLGFEFLNDALGHLAGLMAVTTVAPEKWLFAMTSEDRQAVRKKCIRCFLIRPDDLRRFADWDWCRDHVRVESPWHWFRVVALHRMGLVWNAEQTGGGAGRDDTQAKAPLIDEQAHHDRVRALSVGIPGGHVPIGDPAPNRLATRLPELTRLGLSLPAGRNGETASQSAG